MSSSERSIPHLRDIFGLSGSSGYTMHNNNQLHPSNNLSHYNNHNINHHYQNGNGNNVVSYASSNSNNANNDMNENSSSYGSSYDHMHNNNNHHHPHQQTIDSNALNNNNNNNKKNSKKKRDNSKTLTSGDVKTLERHLSMKKTIRKKIMRDLQQAFVEDPNEFRIENINQEQLKAEIRAEAFRFGATGDHQKPSRKSDNFLDMLRGEKNNSSQQQQQQQQTHHQQQLLPQQHQSQQHYNSASLTTNSSNNYNDYSNGSNREYDYDSQPTQTTEKQSFWRRFTMKNKTKR